jgi:hypothetical protein
VESIFVNTLKQASHVLGHGGQMMNAAKDEQMRLWDGVRTGERTGRSGGE